MLTIKKLWNNLWSSCHLKPDNLCCINPHYKRPEIKLTADLLFDVLQLLSYEECKKKVVASKFFSRIALERMRQQKVKLLQVEKYMRCIYTPEDFEKVVNSGKAVVILKVYRGSKEKLNSACARAYLRAMECLHIEREVSSRFAMPIRFIMDFSDENRSNMAYHYYYQKKELGQVVVIAEVDGILTPYSFERNLCPS
uniref:Uncharacterized protein n=1 Tax=Ditylenchus dipsaci TaxID=166011 RepID=A0A915EVD5_9BILA